MQIVVTGSSGLIGRPWSRAAGGRPRRHTAGAPPGRRRRTRSAGIPAGARSTPARWTGVDAVVHLAGAGIGDQRWTEAYKRRGARQPGRRHADARRAARRGSTAGPRCCCRRLAVGWYGDTRRRRAVDESEPAGEGFLAERVPRLGGRRTARRRRPASGCVTSAHRTRALAPTAALLGKVLPLFRLGLGGRLGVGRQWMPLDLDRRRGRRDALPADHDGSSGPVNLTAPEPVTQRRLHRRAWAGPLHRPAPSRRCPRFALRAGARRVRRRGRPGQPAGAAGPARQGRVHLPPPRHRHRAGERPDLNRGFHELARNPSLSCAHTLRRVP